MIVKCPSCASKFRVPDDKIKPSGVKVRCGRCRKVFRVREQPRPGSGVTPGPSAQPTRPLSGRTARPDSGVRAPSDTESTRVVFDPPRPEGGSLESAATAPVPQADTAPFDRQIELADPDPRARSGGSSSGGLPPLPGFESRPGSGEIAGTPIPRYDPSDSRPRRHTPLPPIDEIVSPPGLDDSDPAWSSGPGHGSGSGPGSSGRSDSTRSDSDYPAIPSVDDITVPNLSDRASAGAGHALDEGSELGRSFVPPLEELAARTFGEAHVDDAGGSSDERSPGGLPLDPHRLDVSLEGLLTDGLPSPQTGLGGSPSSADLAELAELRDALARIPAGGREESGERPAVVTTAKPRGRSQTVRLDEDARRESEWDTGELPATATAAPGAAPRVVEAAAGGHTGRAARWLAASVGVLLAIGGFLAYVAWQNDWLLDFARLDAMVAVAFGDGHYEPRQVRTVRVFEQDGGLVEEPVSEPVRPALLVDNVEQSLYLTAAGVHLLLLEGDVTNQGTHPQRHLTVRGELRRGDGVVAEVVAPAGRTLTQEELEQVYGPDVLDAVYERVSRDADGLVLQPGQRTRFTLVFPAPEERWSTPGLIFAIEPGEGEYADGSGSWRHVVYSPELATSHGDP